jgi:hypothetical protein
VLYPFGSWLPDQAPFQSAASQDANGVAPSVTDYKPVKSFGAVADAITARSQGAYALRNSTQLIFNFCGDTTNLYKMDTDGLGFTDVSRAAGGDYATPATGWWDFTRFGDYVIARNGLDATQVFQAGTASAFTALAGSPPDAYFGGVLGEFSIAARLVSSFNTIAWSAIGDHADWAASATTMSDSQELPDGGPIMGFVGGEVGFVFQEERIRRMTFEGPPIIFRFDPITEGLGIRAGCERSLVAWEGLICWIGQNGFYMMRGGVEIVPIGEGKIDNWFFDDVDEANFHRITSAIDPENRLVVWSYPSTSSGGTPDTLLYYHWPTGKFSYARVALHEHIYVSVAQTGYTLEDLDTVNPSIDALNHSLDSVIWVGEGGRGLAGFNTSHQAGFFDGSNVEATIETGELQFAEGRMSLLRSIRPMVEGTSVGSMSVTIKGRNLLHESPTEGTASRVNANGVCTLREKWRYHRAILTIPAGSTWKHAIGVADARTSIGGAR